MPIAEPWPIEPCVSMCIFSPHRKKQHIHRADLEIIDCLWNIFFGCFTKYQHLIFQIVTDPFVHIWHVMKTLYKALLYSDLIICAHNPSFFSLPLLVCSCVS